MATATYSPEYLAESRTTVLNIFYSIPIPLEIFSTAFRLWVKARPSSQGHLAFDDYLMVWATMVAVAECIAGLVYGAPNGLGRHIQAVPLEYRQKFLMGDYIFSHFYDVAIASTKLSILALYYRIFATDRFRIIVIITAIFVFMWLVAMEVVLGFGCQPVQGWWDASVAATASCVNKVAFTYSTNVTNLITDLWIFAMPIPIIFNLQASLNKRLALCFLFSIGLGTCALSAARLSVVVSVGSDDITWREVPLGILSAWEPCGGILCANLPLIYRAVVRGIKQIRSTVRTSRTRSRHISTRPNSPYLDWTRLHDGASSNNCATSKVTVTRGLTDQTEMDTIGPNGIKVQRDIKQEFHREDSDKLSDKMFS
ncbi:uncharacterized protein F4807DRAFT_464299 [Annulohypoxylon truncatum]|uniref:uncharacterized protein n=1 Tax=Annulohypoxylon truncatum TaxID=327061 RepID=UPI00200775FC|nr:uncharacterized protein F4807DRAFT_464299 [Annulohypoxylon truncatum]KAI1205838.1 hypothetical protein F4807DRAFT_464299 [Annulohypoxylon truncatum]